MGSRSPARAALLLRDGEVHRRYVVVSYEREVGALHAMLRSEGSEHPATRGRLRQLGFVPNASPEARSISWRRDVDEDELPSIGDPLLAATEESALFDVGARFESSGHEAVGRLPLPAFWHGRFLVHVGGTRRSIVFDRGVDEHELARLFDEGRADYFEHEFHAASE